MVSSDALDSFNALDRDEAERLLYGCLPNGDWAASLAAERPFRDFDHMTAAAESAMNRLTTADWLAAFAAHPRIGERGGHSPASSEREQRGVSEASERTLAELAAENRRYEARFGQVFLIAASGRSADEILAELRRRMENDAQTELHAARDELRKITRIRLRSLLSS